jgi:hypothetical protein
MRKGARRQAARRTPQRQHAPSATHRNSVSAKGSDPDPRVQDEDAAEEAEKVARRSERTPNVCIWGALLSGHPGRMAWSDSSTSHQSVYRARSRLQRKFNDIPARLRGAEHAVPRPDFQKGIFASATQAPCATSSMTTTASVGLGRCRGALCDERNGLQNGLTQPVRLGRRRKKIND